MKENGWHVYGLELYTQPRVFSGEVSWPSDSRFSDVLNGAGVSSRSLIGDFLGLVDYPEAQGADSRENVPTIYIRKSAVLFVALTDGDAGRGSCAGQKTYPFVRKSAVPVSLELPTYTITGCIHCGPEETVQDVLNDGRTFLALTDVTIACENRLYGTRPFVAVNKGQIVSSRVEQFA